LIEPVVVAFTRVDAVIPDVPFRFTDCVPSPMSSPCVLVDEIEFEPSTVARNFEMALATALAVPGWPRVVAD
jgi:hypothetical protein